MCVCTLACECVARSRVFASLENWVKIGSQCCAVCSVCGYGVFPSARERANDSGRFFIASAVKRVGEEKRGGGGIERVWKICVFERIQTVWLCVCVWFFCCSLLYYLIVICSRSMRTERMQKVLRVSGVCAREREHVRSSSDEKARSE